MTGPVNLVRTQAALVSGSGGDASDSEKTSFLEGIKEKIIKGTGTELFYSGMFNNRPGIGVYNDTFGAPRDSFEHGIGIKHSFSTKEGWGVGLAAKLQLGRREPREAVLPGETTANLVIISPFVEYRIPLEKLDIIPGLSLDVYNTTGPSVEGSLYLQGDEDAGADLVYGVTPFCKFEIKPFSDKKTFLSATLGFPLTEVVSNFIQDVNAVNTGMDETAEGRLIEYRTFAGQKGEQPVMLMIGAGKVW